MESYSLRTSDLQSASHWGRYNLNYREAEPSQAERSLPCNSAASRLTAMEHLSVPRTRVQRHSSDCDTRRLQPPKPSVTRHESDRQVMSRDRDSQPLVRPLEVRPVSSCLRLSIIRSESDPRKKKVAFADSPSVIWSHSDARSDPAGCSSGSKGSLVTNCDGHSAETAHSASAGGAGLLGAARSGRAANGAGRDAEKQVLTPKERRRRKVAMAVVCTTFILLTASALFVLITLFNASAIDEAVRKENEMQSMTSMSTNGDIHNVTTTVAATVAAAVTESANLNATSGPVVAT